MWNLDWASLGEIALRTVIVYFVLLIAIRFAGKREAGQLTPFDLVVLLLVSNAVQNAMTGDDHSVTGGVVSAITLVVVNYVLVHVTFKTTRLRRMLEGMPVVLVSHGEIQHRNLAREGLSVDGLMSQLRQHEVDSIEKVELAMLEVDGTVSVIRKVPGDETGFSHSRKRLVHHHKRHP